MLGGGGGGIEATRSLPPLPPPQAVNPNPAAIDAAISTLRFGVMFSSPVVRSRFRLAGGIRDIWIGACYGGLPIF